MPKIPNIEKAILARRDTSLDIVWTMDIRQQSGNNVTSLCESPADHLLGKEIIHTTNLNVLKKYVKSWKGHDELSEI